MENQEREELDTSNEATPVEGETTEETTEATEKPEQQEQNIDYHTPDAAPKKPERTEKEKAEFTLKSLVARYRELGGDPSTLLSVRNELDTSQFATKQDIQRLEARKLATNEKEVDAIMAWVNKGLSMEDAHLLANKGRVKSVFSEYERSNVVHQEAVGAGQRKPVVNVPEPTAEQVRVWQMAKMTYDPQTKTAKGKFNEEYWDGTRWASRRLKK